MTTLLSIIVAMDAQRGIGIDNRLPWRLSADLSHFKQVTTGHSIIMGRKTFESIGRPLPNRHNIVVTHNRSWHQNGIDIAYSLDAALNQVSGKTAFVIGGAQIYQAVLPKIQRLIVTEIDRIFPCDAFFPEINNNEWVEISREKHSAPAHEFDTMPLDFAFVTYQRRIPAL